MSLLHEPGVVVMAVYHPDLGLLERQISSLRAQTLTGGSASSGSMGPTQTLVRRSAT